MTDAGVRWQLSAPPPQKTERVDLPQIALAGQSDMMTSRLPVGRGPPASGPRRACSRRSDPDAARSGGYRQKDHPETRCIHGGVGIA